MTRVGWLADRPDHPGGAELTQAEFRRAAPDGVEIVDCPAGGVVSGLDAYVCHNNVQYTLEDMENVDGPCVRYWHDVGPWLTEPVRIWLDRHAQHICCSPVQANYMGLDARTIPPPVDLDRFAAAGAQMNGGRRGVVSVGSWRNYGKAPHKAAEWAADNGIDFYGGGPFAPAGSREIAYEGMPQLLARYRTFVFLPVVLEPFGRVVAEAWAAGAELIINDLVGAKYWITERPEAMETAAVDFWQAVLQ